MQKSQRYDLYEQKQREVNPCAETSRNSSRSVNEASEKADRMSVAIFEIEPTGSLPYDRKEAVKMCVNNLLRTSRSFRKMVLKSIRSKGALKLEMLENPIVTDTTLEDLVTVKNSSSAKQPNVKKRQKFTDGSTHYKIKVSPPKESTCHMETEPLSRSSPVSGTRPIDQSRFETVFQNCFKKALEEALREQSCTLSDLLNYRVGMDETKNVQTEKPYEAQISKPRKQKTQTAQPPSYKPQSSRFSYRSRQRHDSDELHSSSIQFGQVAPDSMDYCVSNPKEIRANKNGKARLTNDLLDESKPFIFKKSSPASGEYHRVKKGCFPKRKGSLHSVQQEAEKVPVFQKRLPHYANATKMSILRAKAAAKCRKGLTNGRLSPRYFMMNNTRKRVPRNLVWEAKNKKKLQKLNNKVSCRKSCRLTHDLIYSPVSIQHRNTEPSPFQCMSAKDGKIRNNDESMMSEANFPIGERLSCGVKRWQTEPTNKGRSYNSTNSRSADRRCETQCSSDKVRRESCSGVAELGTLKRRHADVCHNSWSFTSLGKPHDSSRRGCTVCRAHRNECVGFGFHECIRLKSSYNLWGEKMLSRQRN